MSYFTFLGWFVGIPLLLLAGLTYLDHKQGRHLPATLRSWPPRAVILAHIVVAVLYTTPWDNYLVATRVWWYDPALVTGLVLGWVPIEEYTFFILQTLLTSLWLLLLARRLQFPERASIKSAGSNDNRLIRYGSAFGMGLVWLAACLMLFNGWRPGTYLGLELAWALPPIIFQLAFGADILWHYRRLVSWGIAVPTVYLAATDMVAIGAGTWTIDPAQSTGLLIGNLPIEEFVFFLITNILVVFGTTLVLAEASQVRTSARLQQLLATWWRPRATSITHPEKI